jgi:hypothetical protein
VEENFMNNQKKKLLKDMAIVVGGIIGTLILVKAGLIDKFLISTHELKLVSTFVAGIFAASAFTAGPAVVILAAIAKEGSLYSTALIGGLGALTGDLLIFLFVKNKLSSDLMFLLKQTRLFRATSPAQSKVFKNILAVLGAIVIATPLPDEIGVVMMGLSEMKTHYFFPLVFILHSAGILAIGLIAQAT